MTPLLEKALEAIHHRTNVSTGLAHPNDMNAAKEMFKRLHEAGEILRESEIAAWAEANGWEKKDAEELGSLAQQIAMGKKVKIADGPWWKDDILTILVKAPEWNRVTQGMGKVNHYFLSKLSEINYRMAVHEGDANHRLASEAENIVLFPSDDVPDDYRYAYEEMKTVLKATLKDMRFPFVPSKIRGVRNVTVVKYLALLMSIEQSLRNEAESTDQ